MFLLWICFFLCFTFFSVSGGRRQGGMTGGGWPCYCLSVAVTVEETEREENTVGGFLSGCEIKRSGKMESRLWLAGLFGLGELREERLVLCWGCSGGWVL
jgi:hypothetical protein